MTSLTLKQLVPTADSAAATRDSGYLSHTVKPGESLGKIALQYEKELKQAGIWTEQDDLWDAVKKLAELNNIKNPDRIYGGDGQQTQLRIPTGQNTEKGPALDRMRIFDPATHFAAAEQSSLRVAPRIPEVTPAPPERSAVQPPAQPAPSMPRSFLQLASFIPVPNPPPQRAPEMAPLIVLDPGHGGRDGGASHGGRTEAQLTLRFSQMLAEELRGLGYQVKFTHEGLERHAYLSPEKRFDIISDSKAALAISVHMNSHGGRGHATGHEVYHGEDRGRVSRVFAQNLDQELDQVAAEKHFDTARPIEAGDYWVTASRTIPSVLVELDFIKNKAAVEDEYLRDQVAATVRAIQKSVPLDDPGKILAKL